MIAVLVFGIVYLCFLYVTFQNRLADSFQSFLRPYYKEYGVGFHRDRILGKTEASFYKVYSDPKVLRIEKLSVRLYLYGMVIAIILLIMAGFTSQIGVTAVNLLAILALAIIFTLCCCLVAYESQTKILTRQEVSTYPWYKEDLDKSRIFKFESGFVDCVDWCASKVWK